MTREYKSAKEVWADSNLTHKQQCTIIHDNFLTPEQKERHCPTCLQRYDTCECRWPYPSKGPYSRARFDADIQGIDKMSALYSTLFRQGHINGFKLAALDEMLSKMRKKCAGRLFAVRQRVADREAGTYFDHVRDQAERVTRYNQVNKEKRL